MENESLELAQLAAESALSRRGKNVKILGLRQLATFADYFVICTGTSDRHIAGLTEIIMETLEENGFEVWHKEGERNSGWLLLDYVDVVVHVFLKEAREFYNLERLWADAELVDVPEDVPVEEGYQDEYDELEEFDEYLLEWYGEDE